ncbi:MAG TPA: response regulator transcription factor [Terracidiphilus sp.]|nr:response regulator transcription factor [Terracidiphilus sp.]
MHRANPPTDVPTASPARSAEAARPDDAARVLLVDDDTALCASLQRLLRMEGFTVDLAHTEPDGMQRAIAADYALIILDVMLPGGDGRLALRKIRAQSEVPIIMLTARGDESDRIAGLESGADDYLPKPFSPRELVARIRAVLKRRLPQPPQSQVVEVGDLVIHPLTRRVLKDGDELQLTGAEFDILLHLVKSAGKVTSRDEIAEVCLGRQVGPFDRSVDNHISNLRKKLGPFGDAERIRSARGAGYIYTGLPNNA